MSKWRKGEFVRVQTTVKRDLRQKIKYYVYHHNMKMYELYEKAVESLLTKRKNGKIEYIKPERGGYIINITMSLHTHRKIHKISIDDDVSMATFVHTALFIYFRDLYSERTSEHT